MERVEYSTLIEALKDIPDPRHARGKRHEWGIILALIVLGILNGEHTVHGISRWVTINKDILLALIQPIRGYLPSEATLRRALLLMDVKRGEQIAHRFTLSQQNKVDQKGGELKGIALDGKKIRGVGRHGKNIHLLSVVPHTLPVVIAQREVMVKRNEISEAPKLLKQVDLRGYVVTADALLTQRQICKQIISQGGHYLMVVKGNQPMLEEAIAYLFDSPPWTIQEKKLEYRRFTSVDKGHGRLETRTLEASTTLNEYLDWPHLQQVMRRTISRTNLRTGETSKSVTYGITSITMTEVDAAQLERIWRGHWTIENKIHYVRDVSMGEDAGQAYSGHIPQALALLRNMALTLLRVSKWQSIPDAFRYYRASFRKSLQLLGLQPLPT